MSDLRFAGRQATRNPRFTLLVIFTLGLGIGATMVIFSVFNVVVLRPLPFPQPHQLVRIREVTPQGHFFSISEPNFLDLRESSRSFSHVVAVVYRPMTLIEGGEPLRTSGVGTTNGLFAMLGIQPSLGVVFSPEDFQLGHESRVAIISNGLWQSRFGQDPSVLGRTLNVDGTSRLVIGIMPEGVPPPFAADIWFPLAPDPTVNRAEHRLEGFGRLKDGVSLEQARQDVARLAEILGEEYPQSNAGWELSLVTLREWLIGERATRVATVLLVAVSLLLLLGCASVSNLLLARATARQSEIALRASLGAQRSRIVSQLVIESVALAAVGAAIGILVAIWVLPVIQNLETGALPRLTEVTLDRTVLAFTVLLALATGLICGVAPALQASRRGLSHTMRRAGEMAPEGTPRVRDGLVVTQLALAVVLLVGAGLLANSFLRLLRADPGFDPDNILLAELSPPAGAYPELSREVAILYRDMLKRIEAIPSVVAAGASMVSPVSIYRPANFVGVEGEVAEQADLVSTRWRAVTPGFFDAMGMRLVSGRVLDDREVSATGSPFTGDPNVQVSVVINETLARMLWADNDPAGQRIVWSAPNGVPMTVVGVVGDIRDVTYPDDPGPTVYLPHSIVAWPTMTLLVKTNGEPAGIAAAIRREIWTVDANVPVPLMVPLRDTLDEMALAGPRLNTLLLTTFAAAALGLAALGIYGITVYSVTRRIREIGVRMALGAAPGTIVGMVLTRGARLIVAGTAMGLIGAIALTRFLSTMLYEIQPIDLVTYGAVTLTMAAVALIANYIPARRATQIDPRVAFSTE
ncbi:MAG: ABC transporter permease [Gemmatimonadota bacterium]|nr:MAG: ABC transporter permease [Gemmatimonadota bacterium]